MAIGADMPSGVPYRILAIDDIPSNLLTIQAILPDDEFHFTGAPGGDEAFRLLETQNFDLVLLDVLLPGLDGYAIARKLREAPKTSAVPVIFLTSLTDEDEVVKGFEAGAVDFVSKPFHRTELLLRLRTHLTLKDRNEALQKAAEDLRQANQARDRFFSILAHDLKNPFAGFQSLIHEILGNFDKVDREDLLSILQTMSQTSQNVYRLLETLLDWGRSQTGALSLDPQPQPVRFLVEEAVEPLEEAFKKKGITLDPAPGFHRILVDRYTVVAILRNLLSNALKFTKAGGKVTIRSREAGNFVEITVADNGIGISPSRVPLLFHIENKSSTLGTAREPGTGLGLILCAEFSEKNRGSIRVFSVPGEGTTFYLTLPKAPEDSD